MHEAGLGCGETLLYSDLATSLLALPREFLFRPDVSPFSVARVVFFFFLLSTFRRRFGDLEDVVNAGGAVQVELKKAVPHGKQNGEYCDDEVAASSTHVDT